MACTRYQATKCYAGMPDVALEPLSSQYSEQLAVIRESFSYNVFKLWDHEAMLLLIGLSAG